MRPLVAIATVVAVQAAGLLAGCASVDPTAGFPDVEHTVQERLGKHLHWIQGTSEDAEVEETVRKLLQGPLTVDAAVEIALLCNRSLQAQYEDLGIAQADLVQAGLLRNPTFFASDRFPANDSGGPNIELDLSQSFLEILFLPARKEIAGLDVERAKLRVAHSVLDLAADTRSAYYAAVGARQIADLRKLIAQAKEASALFAQRLYEAGNTSELAMTFERESHEQSREDHSKAETEVIATRERLTTLMGLWGERARWQSPVKLPDVPGEEMPLDRLETLAVSRRLDLAAIREEIRSLTATLALAERVRWFGEVKVGVNGERSTGGQWVVGPNLTFQLPIFDQGQAILARLESSVRQREDHLAALAVEIRAEVRSFRDRLMMSRYRIEHLLKVVIPLREKAVALTQEHWNFMLLGTFELIESKRREFEAYERYINEVRDYWILKSDLVRALGGQLPLKESK